MNAQTRLLKRILITGIALFVLTGFVLTFFYFYQRSVFSSSRQLDSFNRLLGEYDAVFSGFNLTEGDYSFFSNQLDSLEKRAITIESWLSLLKRRKVLADNHYPCAVNYLGSIENALKAFPVSQPLIAAACAYHVKYSLITGVTEEKIRNWLPFLIDPEFLNLRLSVHVLLGDFNSPRRASQLPENIFQSSHLSFEKIKTESSFSGGIEAILLDSVILKIIKGDFRSANSDIQAITNILEDDLNAGRKIRLTDAALRLAAEYHFDFGTLLRSAEIYSHLNDERAFIRQADALYLAGYSEMSKIIWGILSGQSASASAINIITAPDNLAFPDAAITSLYNLAVTSDDKNASLSYLEKLVNNFKNGSDNNFKSGAWQYGLIRYSRMLDYREASAVLSANTNNNYPYIDLELCKRLSQEQNPGRQFAQTWYLLDRYEGNIDLLNWAAWLFFFQRNYAEAQILLDRFNRLQINDSWADVYRAIFLMNQGNLNAAEDILLMVSPQEADWVVHANLGRILETVLSPAKALEQYELAAKKIDLSSNLNLKTAARLQIRIARTLVPLNRFSDAYAALVYALTLDPDNLQARLELERLF